MLPDPSGVASVQVYRVWQGLFELIDLIQYRLLKQMQRERERERERERVRVKVL